MGERWWAVALVCGSLLAQGASAVFAGSASAEWAEDNTCGSAPGAIFPQPVWQFELGEPLTPSSARFTYNAPYNNAPPPGAFTALAGWGDGTTAAVPVERRIYDCYEVSAPSHTYSSPGTYSFSYTVHDSTTQLDHTLGAHSIRIWNPVPQPLAGPGSRHIYPTLGVPWSGVVGEFTVDAPWGPGFYRAEVEWEPGEPAAPGMVSGTNEHLTITASLEYWRPFTGRINVLLYRPNGRLLGKWATLSASARSRASTQFRGRPLLAMIGTGRYELVLRLDRRLPQTRSGHVDASIVAGGETRRVAAFGRHRSHDCYAAALGSLAVRSPTPAGPYAFTLAIGRRVITQLEGHASLTTAAGVQSLRRTAARQLGC